jgi:hypothetical protein
MDEFTIRIPRERQFATVAGLVVGGIAARHDVTLDALDDLQLALDSLLVQAGDGAGDVTIVIGVDSASINASVGPVAPATAGELEADAGESLGLRRLLETVVDGVSLSERDGDDWVELRKGLA